jgi:hypothetical protein
MKGTWKIIKTIQLGAPSHGIIDTSTLVLDRTCDLAAGKFLLPRRLACAVVSIFGAGRKPPQSEWLDFTLTPNAANNTALARAETIAARARSIPVAVWLSLRAKHTSSRSFRLGTSTKARIPGGTAPRPALLSVSLT